MEKERKLLNNEFTSFYEDKKDKYCNRIQFEESDNFSYLDNEIKSRNFMDFYNIPTGIPGNTQFINCPYDNVNNIGNPILFNNNNNNNYDNFQINVNHPYSSDLLKLPIRTLNDEEFVYVNLRQYKRILIRRKQREKQNSNFKFYNNGKPKYQHESRHRHACTRERGKGGRFTSKKEEEEEKNLNEKLNKDNEDSEAKIQNEESLEL